MKIEDSCLLQLIRKRLLILSFASGPWLPKQLQVHQILPLLGPMDLHPHLSYFQGKDYMVVLILIFD